jgi:hypothetical protein
MERIYHEADGLRYEMESRYLDRRAGQFPGFKSEDLIEAFSCVEYKLNAEWHPEVNLGAAVQGDGVLTDHGVSHVKMVMDRATSLLISKKDDLIGYELYILLLSIHFHDLGNIYGRSEHEKKIDDIILKLGKELPLDTVEKNFISTIAMAHGGYNWNDDASGQVTNDKDTLRNLSSRESCNGLFVRTATLAAILRFADELSDDFSRIKNIDIPNENKIYHAYSSSLEPIHIQGNTISFHYRIPYDLTQTKMLKGSTKLYLYDEILLRLAKCMRELEYCRKYANDFINITTLNVKIDIMKPDVQYKSLATETFRLRLSGYPDEKIYKLKSFLEPESERQIYGENNFKDGISLKKIAKELIYNANKSI